MKKVLFLTLLLLSACTNRNTSKHCFEESENMYLIYQDLDTISLSPISKLYPQGFSGYVYCLNSECSVCISSFSSFINELNTLQYTGNVLAIISPATKPIVNHYLKEFSLSENICIILSEDNQYDWGFDRIEKDNGVVYVVSNNQIKEVYRYIPS